MIQKKFTLLAVMMAMFALLGLPMIVSFIATGNSTAIFDFAKSLPANDSVFVATMIIVIYGIIVGLGIAKDMKFNNILVLKTAILNITESKKHKKNKLFA